jgi:hypothetical protein
MTPILLSILALKTIGNGLKFPSSVKTKSGGVGGGICGVNKKTGAGYGGGVKSVTVFCLCAGKNRYTFLILSPVR